MGYGGGPVAFRLLAEDGIRLKLSDLTKGKPLRPRSHLRGRITWTSRGQLLADVAYEIKTSDIAGTVRLVYQRRVRGGAPLSMDYTIGLTVTDQPRKGVRWWFWCERGRTICNVLRLMPGSAVFASAAAFTRPLAYRSQRVCARDRHLERAQAIRASLGGDVNLFSAFPGKPPRMHWSTYARKRAKAEGAAGASLALMAEYLERSGALARYAAARR